MFTPCEREGVIEGKRGRFVGRFSHFPISMPSLLERRREKVKQVYAERHQERIVLWRNLYLWLSILLSTSARSELRATTIFKENVRPVKTCWWKSGEERRGGGREGGEREKME